jgi:hypothetical protein
MGLIKIRRGLIWLRTGTRRGLMWARLSTFELNDILRISWVAEQLLASQRRN